jgi:hypothetical protein
MANIATNIARAGLVSAPLLTSVSAPALPASRDLEGIVARTVTRARAAGRDYMSQSRAAAMAVLAVRPDLSFGQALEAVERLRVA